MTPIAVCLIDDDAIVREALTALLGQVEDIEMRSAHPTAEDLLSQHWLADEGGCDVALVDLHLGGNGMQGLELIGVLAERAPWLRTVALTSLHDTKVVAEVLTAGAAGYLGKDVPPGAIRDGIRAAHRGLLVTSIAQVRGILRRSGAKGEAAGLSVEDQRLLRRVAEGATNAEIAGELHFSESTVKHQVSALMRRLGGRNRVELARHYWQMFQ